MGVNSPTGIPIEDYFKNVLIEDTVYNVEKPQDMYHILSSVFSTVKDYYLSFFDKDFFKTIRVKTQSESLSQFKTFMQSVPTIKNKPIIVFDPADIEMVEDTIFSDVQLMNNRIEADGPTTISYDIPFLDLSNIVDDDTTFGLVYKLNRYRITTDILMIVSGRANQLNLYNNICMNIRHKGSFSINREAYLRIDKAYIVNIAKIFNLEPKSKELLDILNRRSIHPIRIFTYGNGMYDHLMTLPLTLMMTIPNLPSLDSPNKVGMREDSASLRETIIVEVDMPSEVKMLVSDRILTDPVPGIKNPESITYLPPSTENLNVPRMLGDFINMDLIEVGLDSNEADSIAVEVLLALNAELNDYLKLKIKEGKLEDYIKIIAYADREVCDVTIRDKTTLVITEPDMNKMYTLALYVNMAKINKETNDRFKIQIGTVTFEV